MGLIILISSLAVICDQIIKFIVDKTMMLNNSVNIINNFFNLTYVHNEGAAWSILTGNRIFLIAIAVTALVLIYVFFIKGKKLNKLEITSYGLLIGGIIGNLLDRILYGYVIDYLDFKIFNYNFPIFNLADMLIVGSVILIAITIFKGETK